MTEVTIKRVISDTNLLQAWYKVKANQGCAGIDWVSLEDFERNLFSKLALLKDEVHYGTYRPKPLLRVHIPKKSSAGLRPLSIPVVRDRVLQTAVFLIIEPLFEAEFEECSFAYRQGRSVNMAVDKIERLRDEGFVWIVDVDIKSYFDEVDHNKLMVEVRKLISDQAILRLIKLWLNATVREGDRVFTLKKGVPQGSPVSPLLANLYLDKLDESMLGKKLRLVRFSDDFIILCKTKKQATKALEFTEDVLETLKLQINKAKTNVVDFNQGFRFLGVDFIRSLTVKAQYPDLKPTIVNLKKLAVVPEKASLPGKQCNDENKPPDTLMADAFVEAGVEPESYPENIAPITEERLQPDVEEEQHPGRPNHDPLLRTLYLFTPGVVLGKESERFTIRKSGEIVQRVLAIKVDQVMVFGNIQLTTQAMRFCIAEKIPVFLLSGKGRFYGVIDGFDTDPVLLHRDQFNRAEDQGFCLKIATAFIRGKIANCRVVLQRQKRRRSSTEIEGGIQFLKTILAKMESASSLDQLRGYEGTAARAYFKVLGSLVDPDIRFSGRRKRPPRDPVNSMLSYGYTLLFYNLYSLLRARGLNPHVGFLHPVRPGHPALVSDMMEEFRAPVVDTVILRLVLNRRITADDFSLPKGAGSPCLLGERSRNIFVSELEKKLNSSLTQPSSGLHLDYRRCMEHQVLHLARVVQGKDDIYQPLVLK